VDLVELAQQDPVVAFTPEDARKPRGAGVALDSATDETAEATEAAMEAEARAERLKYYEDKQPWYSHAVNFFRVPQETFRSIERHSRVPLHTMFRHVEDGLDEVAQAVTDPIKEVRHIVRNLKSQQSTFYQKLIHGNREEKKQVQRLFEERFHNPQAALELEKKMHPQIAEAATQLKGVYQRYWNSQGLSNEEIDAFLKVSPFIREHDGDYLAFKSEYGSRIPKMMYTLEDAFKTGEIMLDSREWDFQKIATTLITTDARQRKLAPAWNMVKSQMDFFARDRIVPGDVLNIFHGYMDEVRYVPDTLQIALARSFNKVTQKLVGKELTTENSFSVVPAFLEMNYYSNMAWNTGTAIRNFMQPWMTTYPIMGEKWAWKGYETAAKAMRDPKILDYYAKLGVITRDVEPMAASSIRGAMRKAGAAGGRPGHEPLDWMRDHAWTMFRSAENVNRIMSYDAMVQRAGHYGKMFASGKIKFKDFHELSKLDWMDDLDGPITLQVRAMMEGGQAEKAIHLMGLQFVRKTQFVYRRGNAPYAMMGTMGHLLGQYGTWPAWYASYMSDMFFRGSAKNRIAALTRWTGANAAVMVGGSQVFGVEMGNWAFFSPFGYTGGPVVDIARNLKSGADVMMGSQDPVDRIQAARLRHAYTQVIPGVPWRGAIQTKEAFDAILQSDWKTATKRFLGFQPTEETRPPASR